MLIMVISAIVVLGALIFVHELGHFLVAKWVGVGVEKFSLGFGPKIVGFRRGETEYLLSAFPLGGYVKMVGENDDGELSDEQQAKSFLAKPPLLRIAIVAAGPLSNLLFAWVLVIVVHLIGVPTVRPVIGEVIPGTPAERAGIRGGDLVRAIGGVPVTRWDDISEAVLRSQGKEIQIRIAREGSEFTLSLVPELREGKNLFGESVKQPVIGIVSARNLVTERFPLHQAVARGTEKTVQIVRVTILSLVKLIQRVVPLDSVGGPIMIAKMAGEQVQQGGVSFLMFMALLSINLGILNLLPVPILDGGHLFFYGWEAIFSRPVSMRAREIAQQIGLFILISLMILAFYNDIMRYVVG